MANDIMLTAEDGVTLNATLFESATPNGVAVLINPALSTPRQYYRHFAGFLATQGFTVLSYDYRGYARSPSALRSNQSSITDWGRLDQTAAASFLLERFPDAQLVLVAHSMGGQIIGLTPLAEQIQAALILTTSHGYLGMWSGFLHRLWQRFLWNLVVPPLLVVCGYLPGRYIGMFDMPAPAAWELRRFCKNRHWLCDRQGNPLRPYNNQLRAPLKHVVWEDDRVVPPGTQMIIDSYYPNAQHHEELLAPARYGMEQVGHFGFFRRTMALAAWEDAASWLNANARLAAN